MTDPRTDEIAREAARLIETGKAGSIHEAIRRATEFLGHFDAPRPGSGAVRRHAQGMAMQALGDVGYHDSIVSVWRAAEEIMTALERYDPRLLGRAAKGQIDAGVTLHLHIYTRDRIGAIADWLVQLGFDDPDLSTADTRSGRFDRLNLQSDGLDIVITRLPPDRRESHEVDLFSGKSIESLDLPALRRRIEEAESSSSRD